MKKKFSIRAFVAKVSHTADFLSFGTRLSQFFSGSELGLDRKMPTTLSVEYAENDT